MTRGWTGQKRSRNALIWIWERIYVHDYKEWIGTVEGNILDNFARNRTFPSAYERIWTKTLAGLFKPHQVEPLHHSGNTHGPLQAELQPGEARDICVCRFCERMIKSSYKYIRKISGTCVKVRRRILNTRCKVEISRIRKHSQILVCFGIL